MATEFEIAVLATQVITWGFLFRLHYKIGKLEGQVAFLNGSGLNKGRGDLHGKTPPYFKSDLGRDHRNPLRRLRVFYQGRRRSNRAGSNRPRIHGNWL